MLVDKLVSVATDGAPAMVGINIGLVGFLKSDSKYPEFLPVHCIIHRKQLTGKHFKYENVMETVLKFVNYIRLNGKTLRVRKLH